MYTFYMKAGTSNAPKYFPVHEIRMLLSIDLVDTLLAFHAISGYDSVSQFTGLGGIQSTAHWSNWPCQGLSLTENIATSTEKFICKIYGVPEVDTCKNTGQVVLYRSYTRDPATNLRWSKVSPLGFTLPSKCLEPHSPYHDLPPVTEMGWMHLDGRLVARLLSLPPIPKACREITSCGWTKRCLSQRCSCRKIRMESRRATAGNLATPVVTLMATRNKFKWVHLPVYMINSCTHMFPANI